MHTPNTEQGPNVTDPDARAILAAAGSVTIALDYLLCAVNDSQQPNTEEIAQALCEALDKLLDRYPQEAADSEGRALHSAVRAFLGEDAPALPGLRAENPDVHAAFAATSPDTPLPWDFRSTAPGQLFDAQGRRVVSLACPDPRALLLIQLAVNTCGGFRAKLS